MSAHFVHVMYKDVGSYSTCLIWAIAMGTLVWKVSQIFNHIYLSH